MINEKKQTYSEAKKFNFLYYIIKKIISDARNNFFNIFKKKQNIPKKKQ